MRAPTSAAAQMAPPPLIAELLLLATTGQTSMADLRHAAAAREPNNNVIRILPGHPMPTIVDGHRHACHGQPWMQPAAANEGHTLQIGRP